MHTTNRTPVLTALVHAIASLTTRAFAEQAKVAPDDVSDLAPRITHTVNGCIAMLEQITNANTTTDALDLLSEAEEMLADAFGLHDNPFLECLTSLEDTLRKADTPVMRATLGLALGPGWWKVGGLHPALQSVPSDSVVGQAIRDLCTTAEPLLALPHLEDDVVTAIWNATCLQAKVWYFG